MYALLKGFPLIGFGRKQPIYLVFFVLLSVILCSCQNKGSSVNNDAKKQTLFKLLPPDQTNIHFTNTLTEGLNTNVLMYQYFYNGGGVAIGDLNSDGLDDIYFTGNMTDNKLYLNNGHMQFTDVTGIAGVAGRPGPWKTGVTFVDINGDGKLDIFVCYSGHLGPQKRVNELFINQGNDKNGVPIFKEMAAAYGLNFSSYSTQAYFFDYDRDGDLDMLLVNHNIERLNVADEVTVSGLMKSNDSEAGIRLFRNDNGVFHDVTKQSGILNTSLSYGLAAGISDVNGDGWPDIYISNDYSVPDRLYINKGKGTFQDELPQQIGHTSFSSMGNDITDINNDLKPDILTLDMLPEGNSRQKLLFGADNYEAFNLNLRMGFYYQYMRNMLQLNNGNGTFSEIGQLAGISNTDWSWTSLIADYDNDGWKDIFITNGYVRDYTNMDFLKLMSDNLGGRSVTRQDLFDLSKQMPTSNIFSYFFQNKGNLTFTNKSFDWGITQPSNSNGAAFGDLNNDGNLDIVVNNINKPAFIYQNQAGSFNHNHYLEVKLAGGDKNTQAIGAKVFVYTSGQKQYLEQMPTRGYQSGVSPVLHFGLGKNIKIDSLRVIWPRGKTQLICGVKGDQKITLHEIEASGVYLKSSVIKPLFSQVRSPINLRFSADSTNDFKRQPLMVNPMSLSGPCIVSADVNADGIQDIYIGGENGRAGRLYLGQKNGGFIYSRQPAFESDKKSNDAAAIFFDANGDGKPDLYVCSGGYNAYSPDDPLLQDRLYLNDGRGGFIRAKNALPKMLASKGCVSVADINGDGFPDLFVGGRVVPGRYPETPESYLLINDGKGHFSDQTNHYNSALKHIGMVTGAAWADMNGDGKPDLILVGEWMPISVFENKDGHLVDATKKYFAKPYSGWWNTVQVTDINHDGHPDIIAGNLGLNSQCKASDSEPAEIFFKDFDNNGTIDPVLCFYIKHKSYPFVTRDELLKQISMMRSRFPDYNSYADATIDKIFTTEEMKNAGHFSANFLATGCFISDQSGKLREMRLPLEAQFAPVFSVTLMDYDHDGNADLLLCGNMNHARIHFGKYDANYGLLLKGDGKGGFTYIDQQQSGFKLTGDVRGVVQSGKTLLFSINGIGITAYREN